MSLASTQTRTSPGLQIAITREGLAYVVIVIAALILRVPALDALPLDDREAGQAIAAWQVVSGEQPDTTFIENPLIFASTTLGFTLAGASNTAARLLPMLAGLGLVLLPLTFRDMAGRLPMLLASALLAISPGMVAASRRMDGVAASLFFLVLALWVFRRYTATRSSSTLATSGVLLGLALLADFFTLAGAVGILVGIGAVLLRDDEQLSAQHSLRKALQNVTWQVAIIALAGTIFMVATLGLTNPAGLGASADLLSRLVTGVVRRPEGAPFLFGVLTLYEAPILIFGVIGLARGLSSEFPHVRFLSGWAIAAMLTGFIYPGGLPSHVLWMVLPLAMLAGLALADIIFAADTGPIWSLALQTIFVVALFSASLLWTTSYLRSAGNTVVNGDTTDALARFASSLGFDRLAATLSDGIELPLRLFLALLMPVLAIVSTLLLGSFRGRQHAWRGFGLAVLAVTLLTALTGSAGLAFGRASNPFELWNIAPAQPALYALNQTAQDVSAVANTHPLDATVTIQGTPYSALAWAMRDFKNVTFVDLPSPEVTSDLVITNDDESTPVVGERYIGQDFVITRSWNPVDLNLRQALHWLFFREGATPADDERVILWVRDDIYRLLPDAISR